MLILRHNTLPSEDLFVIERRMIKVADPKYNVKDLTHFVVLDKSRAELYGYLLGFMERLGLCESIGVTPSEFLDFLIDIDHGYLPNAYHSFYHAVDVAIVLYQMVCGYGVANYISRVDIAALLIAGLCHDIGHPGKNNNYQVNLKTDLAIRYSNKSVLESYSCTLTMDLLTKHKLFKRLEDASSNLGLPTSESEMRTMIIKMILATDMIFHYELQENLANILEIISEENLRKEELLKPHPSSMHKPVLPSTTEENEDEDEEDEEDKEERIEEKSVKDSSDQEDDHTESTPMLSSEEEYIRLKDIFSNQGAKSAISYFRRKSYFEEDMIPLNLKTIPVFPASPEELNDDDNDYMIDKNNKKMSLEVLHSSGIDLITSTITENGVEKIVYIPPNYIMEPQQRLILCQIVLHAADISNALRPWPICLSWSNLVCEEFFLQGDAEKEHGLEVSPNMDRSQVSQTTIGLQFGDFVVSPYFEIFAALFPKADELLKTLVENRTQWIKLEEEIKDKKDREEKEGNQRLPSSMLPDRPIINPSGRRVSVAAGMVIIPDELEERTVGSGKYKRKYWGVRSVSHSDISSIRKDQQHRDRSEVIRRRKSEEPNLIITRKLRYAPMSPRRSSREKKSSTLPVISQK
ncbi:uncharacterized protein BX663DRAFT_519155 [Cokeromyces recurvatus]|uniref:uncharacterized protein n=1 Tax=Cokeromyces recurvatus TaxID=90255 RepID=UPI00221E70AE|nr:uncharacterized protein BX663DRAFT_519155 [Cokeromyces recurvatus]KAI7899969.1 hypothetical protein BX663DRAFT_519155 [Cokeromyces recurvatus]